jgi:hypothetical protein
MAYKIPLKIQKQLKKESLTGELHRIEIEGSIGIVYLNVNGYLYRVTGDWRPMSAIKENEEIGNTITIQSPDYATTFMGKIKPAFQIIPKGKYKV